MPHVIIEFVGSKGEILEFNVSGRSSLEKEISKTNLNFDVSVKENGSIRICFNKTADINPGPDVHPVLRIIAAIARLQHSIVTHVLDNIAETFGNIGLKIDSDIVDCMTIPLRENWLTAPHVFSEERIDAIKQMSDEDLEHFLITNRSFDIAVLNTTISNGVRTFSGIIAPLNRVPELRRSTITTEGKLAWK